MPAVVLAAAPTGAPSGVTATSGDGTMTLNWSPLTDADGGYDFRYADNAGAVYGASWYDVPGTNEQGTTTVTLPFEVEGTQQHKLTVGTTYFFQVRGKDSDENAGPESNPPVFAMQRAKPPRFLIWPRKRATRRLR